MDLVETTKTESCLAAGRLQDSFRCHTSKIVISMRYERSILFTFVAIACMSTSAQRKIKHELLSHRRDGRTKGLSDIIC